MNTKKIGVIGSGDVGKVLAAGFKKHGHDVTIGSREGNKLGEWSAAQGIPEATFAEVAAGADILVLAVLGRVAEDAIRLAGIDNLAGKTVIDATNPIAAAPPVNGVLQYFTGPNDSLMERLQALAPAANFVKAFSSVGNPSMINPSYAGRPPDHVHLRRQRGRQGEVTAGSSISSAGTPRTWAASSLGPRDRAAVPAVVRPRLHRATSGRTPSSCCTASAAMSDARPTGRASLRTCPRSRSPPRPAAAPARPAATRARPARPADRTPRATRSAPAPSPAAPRRTP
jgi:hypothetical protein